MKRVALWVLLFGVALGVRAQSPDTDFLRIYNLIQEAEGLEGSGQASDAYEKFSAAQRDLQAFARAHPSWNPKIIRFRTEFLSERLEGLKPAQAVPAVTAGAASRSAEAVTSPAVLAVRPTEPAAPSDELARAQAVAVQAEAKATAAESRAEAALQQADQAAARVNEANERLARLALDLRQARDRVEVLEAANANLDKTRARLDRERNTLEARLKEALSPRAAATDPAELARAEDRILMLVKENEILKAGLDHQVSENRRIVETAQKALELEQQLKSARTELTALRRQTEELQGERQRLAGRLDTLTRTSEAQAAAAKGELEGLRKELSAARSTKAAGNGDAGTELASIRAELNQQRLVGEQLRRENESLVREIAQLTDIRVTPASLKVSELPAEDSHAGASSRYRRLEQERDELRRELESARAELRRVDRSRGDRGAQQRTRELTREVARLQARVGALESKADPYSAEELALFQTPTQSPRSSPVQVAQAQTQDPAPSAAPSGSPAPASSGPPTPAAPDAAAGTSSTNAPAASRRRTIRDLPPGASVLAAQAQRAFGQRRLDEAERAYREILKIDENNVFTLGNLAAIVVEQGRVEEGETILKRALELDPQDPFSLSLLGILRFRQQRYDEAFDALSQAAQLDPEDPATQTYLGITLSERGQRPAAEAALRKALKLNPRSAAAHYNLSVVYATQKPPFLELARYHYEKARRAGQPANPAFEALLKGETRRPATESGLK